MSSFVCSKRKPGWSVTMVRIKNQPAVRVAYMRHRGPYGSEVGRLWERMRKWAAARDLLGPETVTLGISHDNPEVTPSDKCRYDACVPVSRDFVSEGEINVQIVPGGKYAVYEWEGGPEEVGQAWQDLFAWLPDSGFQPDDRPCFERYPFGNELDPRSGAFRCEICVPVKPL